MGLFRVRRKFPRVPGLVWLSTVQDLGFPFRKCEALPNTASPLSSGEKDPVSAPCPRALAGQGRADGLSWPERGAHNAEDVGLIPVGAIQEPDSMILVGAFQHKLICESLRFQPFRDHLASTFAKCCLL